MPLISQGCFHSLWCYLQDRKLSALRPSARFHLVGDKIPLETFALSALLFPFFPRWFLAAGCSPLGQGQGWGRGVASSLSLLACAGWEPAIPKGNLCPCRGPSYGRLIPALPSSASALLLGGLGLELEPSTYLDLGTCRRDQGHGMETSQGQRPTQEHPLAHTIQGGIFFGREVPTTAWAGNGTCLGTCTTHWHLGHSWAKCYFSSKPWTRPSHESHLGGILFTLQRPH